MGSYKMCLCFTRKFMSREADPPPDVVHAFNAFSDAAGQMTADQLQRFMKESQGGATATVADAVAVIEQIRHRRPLGIFTKHSLSLEDFHHYLFSDDLNPPKKSVHHDMTAPLSHYFIYTGHNSYLTGNQISSDCSDAPIIMALKRGVRVIELDIWPNSTKDDVNVLHGRTLTTPVELIKCLRSIKEHAFVASTYPLVITLEDHLTPDLQAKVAEMVHRTFGAMLFLPNTELLTEFPSPEELKYRIIISTKPPKEYLGSKTFKKNGSQTEKESTDKEAWGMEVPDFKTTLEADDQNESECSNPSQDEDDEDEDDRMLPQNSAPQYKHLIAIRAGNCKNGLKNALKVVPNEVKRLSLSEQVLEKAASSRGTDLVRFTQTNLLRVYPKGMRVDSSNYDPFVGWKHGAQMVAFNMQDDGKSLWLMHGFFRANGGCGFVKKPDFLMGTDQDNEVFNPKEKLQVKKRLKVKVYMGDGWRFDFKKTHFDRYSPPDFYARVGIAGVPADCVMKKTKTLEDNWTPVWNEEFEFPLTVPELALLRIEVREYDLSGTDDFGGQNCLPVSELRSGIRAVPLYDRKCEKYESVKLLMRFELV